MARPGTVGTRHVHESTDSLPALPAGRRRSGPDRPRPVPAW